MCICSAYWHVYMWHIYMCTYVAYWHVYMCGIMTCIYCDADPLESTREEVSSKSRMMSLMARTWMSHLTHMNESCHTREYVTSHTSMSHVTHMDESHHTCHTYEWVCVTPMNGCGSNREAPEITYAASPKWRLCLASAATAQRIFRCLVCLFSFPCLVCHVWSFPVWSAVSIALCCFLFRPAALCCTLLHAQLLHSIP